MSRFAPLLLRAGLRYTLRHRWQGLLALSGIVLGVAVVLAVDLANRGARAAFELSVQQLQGRATHRLVVAGGEVPDTVYVELQRQPGAPPMAPVVTAWITLEPGAQRYRLAGFDLFAEAPFRSHLAGIADTTDFTADWLTRPGAVVLSVASARALGVDEGDSLDVSFRGRSATLQVLRVAPLPEAVADDLLLVDIATAKSLLGMQGYLSHVDLILDAAGEAWIRQRLPAGVQLRTMAEEVEGVTRLSAAFELNLTAMSLLAMLVGMFLIFNAMSFSMVQRRTLFGRLRAIGVTPRELFVLVLLEAAILAVLGSALGLLFGLWLGQGLTRLVAATVSDLYYQVSTGALHADPRALALAVAVGVLATLAATVLPAWQAARTPPLTTLSRAALEASARRAVPLWALFGFALLAAGLALALLVPGGIVMSFAGLFSVVLGAAMMTPMAVRLAHRLLVRARLPGVWRMGVRDLDRHLSRLGVAVAALMVALSAAVGVGVMVQSMRGAVNSWLYDLLQADVYVAAESFAEGTTVPDEVVQAIAQLPGVAAVSRYRERRLPVGGRRVELIGAHMVAPSRRGFVFLDSVPSLWPAFDAGGLLVSEPLAWHLGLAPGDRLSLPTPAGPVALPVAAVFRDYASEHGRIFMDEATYRRHWPDQRVNTLALFASDGDVANMRRNLADTAARHELVLTPAAAILDESMAVFDRTFRVTQVLRAVSLMVAFIGVLSALMALQLERGKEYAVLRALGLTRAQIAGLIGGGSLLMGLLAALVAVPTGILMAWVLIQSVQRRAFGWTMPFSVDGNLLMQTLLVGLLAAGLAAIYPAWRSVRRDPAPQLRED